VARAATKVINKENHEMSETNEGGNVELNQTQETRNEQSPSPERRRLSPRIYVASLADYNAGELLGAWIDAAQEPEALHADIDAMLAQSDEEVAEDWAIHDYEGFGPFRLHEYETMEVVSAVAKGIAEHGTAFAAYVDWAGTSEEALRAFGDCYLGQWPSLDDYARELADDFGWEEALRKLPEDMQHYVAIDYEGVARLAETMMNIVEYDDAIYVFSEQ
jgi:antirestriction protein